MGALTIFANLFSDSVPKLRLNSVRCLRSRLNTNQCQRCLECCPSKALIVDNHKICLDIRQCTGCMSCVATCPQDAFICDHDLDEMLSLCQPGADVIISCTQQVQKHPDEMIIPCVGIFSRQFLAAMFLSGCRSLSFNVLGCASCRNHSVSEVFMNNCTQIFKELSSNILTKVVLATKSEELSSHEWERRSYLANVCEVAVDISKKSFGSTQSSPLNESKKCRMIPFKTQMVKKSLTNLDRELQKKILGLFVYNVSVSEECNCCPMCKGICPTGAIKIHRSEQGKRLQFERLECSGCGLCVEFCKKNAISLERYS